MIKGIISFFTSGAFLNPMVLSGLVLGAILSATMEYEQIFEFYTNYHLYLFAFFISTVYVLGFKKTYKMGGREVDYFENTMSILGGALKFVFSSYLTVSFVMMLAF